MANQEFDKTGYTTFGPFFATNYSAPSRQSYSKHPHKTHIQEFDKTGCATFGPSFIKSSATIKSNYSKHPRKMTNQEFDKTGYTTFGPFFEYFCRFLNPQHNGKDGAASTQTHQSIKVRSREMGKADAEE